MSGSGRLADRLRGELERAIVAGEFGPGTRLEEAALARRFGVSRTPVREALMQMSSTGLVEVRSNQGAFVAAMTLEKMMELFEVMAELEALCARLAARRMGAPERAALEAAHGVCVARAAAGDPDAYYEANRVFHELIYAGSHNQALAETTAGIRNRVGPYRRMQLHQRGRLKTSLAEHAAVVAAILAGEPEPAAQAMRAHIAVQGDVFADFVAMLKPSRAVAAGS